MGANCCSECPLSPEELSEYEFLTYLTRGQILSAFKRFRAIDPLAVQVNRGSRLPLQKVLDSLPQLRLNPFGDLLCRAFSSERDGRLGFDDFLDLVNVLSPACPLHLKTHYAFLVLDVDGDGVVGKADLFDVVGRLFVTEEKRLTRSEKNRLVDRIQALGC